jgi:hypothetical protein
MNLNWRVCKSLRWTELAHDCVQLTALVLVMLNIWVQLLMT